MNPPRAAGPAAPGPPRGHRPPRPRHAVAGADPGRDPGRLGDTDAHSLVHAEHPVRSLLHQPTLARGRAPVGMAAARPALGLAASVADAAGHADRAGGGRGQRLPGGHDAQPQPLPGRCVQSLHRGLQLHAAHRLRAAHHHVLRAGAGVQGGHVLVRGVLPGVLQHLQGRAQRGARAGGLLPHTGRLAAPDPVACACRPPPPGPSPRCPTPSASR